MPERNQRPVSYTHLDVYKRQVLASPDSLYAFRDPNGIRPLCIGELPDGRGWAVSSETCGLDIVGARYVRDVAPGEIVRFNEEGMHAEQGVPAGRPAACIFEYVYLSLIHILCYDGHTVSGKDALCSSQSTSHVPRCPKKSTSRAATRSWRSSWCCSRRR